MRSRRFLGLAFLVLGAGCGKSLDLSCPAPIGTKWDADGDLLTDAQETALGTDPKRADSDGDGFSDYAEVMAGTDPLSAASKPSGAIASIRQITAAADLIGGPAAQGVLGDWLIENDRVRAIVQDVTHVQQQIGSFGGNLIDADVQRGGAPGNDIVGTVIPLMALAFTTHPNRAIVVRDGSDGGPAILRTCGAGDTYQSLDLWATLQEFGVNTAWQSNTIYPVEMSNDYVLAPGSATIEIVTTIRNKGKTTFVPVGDILESGGAQEIWNTNTRGFGSSGISEITSPQPDSHYLGYLAPGAGWSYTSDADPNIAITISGVTVAQQEFTSALDIVSTNPSMGEHPGLNKLEHGGRFSWHRGITVTDGSNGVDPFNAVWAARHVPAAKPHSGTVLDDSGAPIEHVRVVALLDTYPVDVAESDATGNYTLTLPPGTYDIAADIGGRPFPAYSGSGVATVPITTRFSGNAFDAAEVTFAASEAGPDITFTKPARLGITVTETGTGLPLPSRVVVVGSDPSPGDSIFRDPHEQTSSVVSVNAISKNGVFAVDLEPGSYEVYATHGIEFSISSAGVLAVAGSASNVALSVGRVIDTTGWISADFHVHMLNSPDSPVPLADRAIDGAAEGLDVLVPTDHDYITDLTPTIAALGLSSNLASVPGEEITTWTMGHFNAWPLAHDPNRPQDGGAYKWSGDGYDHPITNKPLSKIFGDVDAEFPGTTVKQVNHPRSNSATGFVLNQYFSAIQLDTATLKTKKKAEFFRIPEQPGTTSDDTKLFYDAFDAQEVANGFDGAAVRNANLNDLMTFLSHGMTVAGMGNSDSHKLFSDQLGYPRNYLALADDAPAHLAANVEAFAKAATDGHTFFTQGPFVKVTVHGQTDGGPGDLVKPTSGHVTLDAIVDWPAWIGVDTLHIHMNAPDTITPPDVDGNTVHPATIAGGVIDLRPLTVLKTATNGLPYYEAVIPTQSITTPASGDAWILVDVLAEQPGTKSLFPIVPVGPSDASGVHAYAMVNAVFVDGNGNGTFDAPGIIVTPNAPHLVPTPLHHWDATKGEVPPGGTAEIRAQFEQLERGACRGDAGGKRLDQAE